MLSSTRTKEYLDKKGIKSGLVERYNAHSNKKIDLFNIIDIIALYPDGICGIQTCGSDFKAHDEKIKDHVDYAYKWILCGGILELWGWRKLKLKRGGKAIRWTPRIKRYMLEDF